MSILLGTTIGGGRIHVGAVDGTGTIRGRAVAALESTPGAAAFVESLDALLREAARGAGADLEGAAGIGVAAPGQVDRASGAVIHAPNLGWVDVPLGDLLRGRFRCPIAVENDVKAAAVGEARYGAGEKHGERRNLTLISVGRGLGGGIIANGELVGGATGAAGEMGHMVFRPEGKVCSCGTRGHYEAYAGAACVEQKFRRIVREGTPTLALEIAGGDPDAITLATIFEAADRGDDAAAAFDGEIREALGTLAANVATLVNPALLLIGGSIVKLRRSLVADCAAAVARSAMRAAARACRVVEPVLWEDAAILGAAELVRRAPEGRPA